ncbi:hypothetical protein [Tunicatimonas pelagia]|uniref:hypothetical protein n=1 Tax=Tunicatimonas pelagia TaxID=931531 RepID=UPI0026665881|nr:hypothetical protein [Tunicatimonas pelagia]WKN44018.1 hypothetical protein P0M28_03405 [Tunicatimonas pelagia]
MNQQFNITRFSLMLKLYWAESGRYYLLSLGIAIGTMLMLMLPIVGTSQFSWLLYGLHILTFFGGTMLGGIFFTNTAFAAYNTTERGVSSIMIPASQLEKFAPLLLISLLGSVLVFVTGVQLHQKIATLADQNLAPGGNYKPIPTEVLQFYGYVYFILQGAIFLGSLYFTKNSLIKTISAILVVTLVAFVFNLLLAYHFTGYPRNIDAFPFTVWNVNDTQRYTILYPSAISNLIKVFLGLIVVALIGITYVRLREKEI